MPQSIIVNFTHLNPAFNGGTSRIGFHVARLLLEQPNVRPVFIVNLGFAPKFSAWLGVPAVIIPVMLSTNLLPLQIARIRRALSPKIIVSPLFGMTPFNTRSGIRHVVGMPDTLVLDHPEQFSQTEISNRRKIYDKLRVADQVVTISQFAADSLKQHLQLTDQQLVVAPLASNETIEPDLSLVPEGRYWFYPANLWPHKRHELLLRAFAYAHDQDPTLRLILTGNASQFHGLFDQLLQSLELTQNQVQHLGYVTDAQLLGLYQGAEVMVFTSEYEGFGMPLLEAMQAGCPVICAPVTAIPEVAGDAALYVDSDDPVEWANAALQFRDKRTSLIAAGYAHASNFSWEQTRKQWLKALMQVGMQTGASKNSPPPQIDFPINEFVELQVNFASHRQQAQALPHLWRVQHKFLLRATNFVRA